MGSESMSRCYYCRKKFDNKNVLPSKEHIIQNALGGHLHNKNILCKSCNNELEKLIDTPFIDILKPIYARLPFKTDRKSESPKLHGKHRKLEIPIISKDYRDSPKKPHYDSDNRILYAPTNDIGLQYKKKLINEGKISDNDRIIIRNDLPGLKEYSFDLDNIVFKKGFLKIAVGFAVHCGIDPENLDLAINGDKSFVDQPMIIPYLPQSAINIYYDYNNDYYPIHLLKLMTTNNKELYCHIELFSTFKFTVFLSKKYDKIVKEFYIYDISNNQEIKTNDYISQFNQKLIRDSFLCPYSSFSDYLEYVNENRHMLSFFGHIFFRELEKHTNIEEIFEKLKK